MNGTSAARFDIVIVGGGIAGLALALTLAPRGLRIALLEAAALPTQLPAVAQGIDTADPRVSALGIASTRLLDRLGAWQQIPDAARSPYAEMKVWEEDGTGHIEFAAADIHEPLLGHIVENRWITGALLQCLLPFDNVELFSPARLEHIAVPITAGEPVRIRLASGEEFAAALLVGADGAQSKVRELCAIDSRVWDCEQFAIVTTVATSKPHRRTAWQCFRQTGPLAFLPLAVLPEERACSIVWSVDTPVAEQLMNLPEAEFAEALASAIDHRLGTIETLSRRWRFPLRQHHAAVYRVPGVVLVADAAHAIHPLAGQGINLGLSDVAVLGEEIGRALDRGREPGDADALARYQRRRRGENEVMLQCMGVFKRLYGETALAPRLLRNIGMSAVNRAGPVKQLLMRQAMGISF